MKVERDVTVQSRLQVDVPRKVDVEILGKDDIKENMAEGAWRTETEVIN